MLEIARKESFRLRLERHVVRTDENLATVKDRQIALNPGDRLQVIQAVSGG